MFTHPITWLSWSLYVCHWYYYRTPSLTLSAAPPVCQPTVTNGVVQWLTCGHQRGPEVLQAGRTGHSELRLLPGSPFITTCPSALFCPSRSAAAPWINRGHVWTANPRPWEWVQQQQHRTIRVGISAAIHQVSKEKYLWSMYRAGFSTTTGCWMEPAHVAGLPSWLCS